MPDRPTDPATRPLNADERRLTDEGALRDKVAVGDPTAAPAATDSETTGTPTPAAATEQAAHRQSAAAHRAVPRLDRDRAVSTAEHPWLGASRSPIAVALALSLAGVAAFVAVTLVFTLP